MSGLVPLPASRALSPERAAAYLDRLDIRAALLDGPTLATLTALCSAHCSRVAYENLDLHADAGGPVPTPELDPGLSADRIAGKKRGSYCFLLVDAFASLLTSLGFVVSMHTAGVGEDPLPAEKWGNHIVLLAHLADGPYIADVGLGDGPSRPFALATHAWEEEGYHFSLEDRGGGVWRFTHDPLGSFDGFNVDISTSAAGAHEFADYHKFYWEDPSSNYRTAGLVLQRVCPGLGILTLRNCTLQRIHPRLPGGSTVLATAGSAEHLFALALEHFLLPLSDLSNAQRSSLWGVAKAKHEAWLAAKRAGPCSKLTCSKLCSLLGHRLSGR